MLDCPCLVVVLPNNPDNKMPNPYLQNNKNPIFSNIQETLIEEK